MPYNTDERLKSYLDTNQLQRERMCLAILAIDKRFTNVSPRHPRGGPDGGRDIEATFQGAQKAFAAVGFVNQANDSTQHKRAAKRKFEADLASAIDSDSKLQVFVFFTNVSLTTSEKETLCLKARSKGIKQCEILDRERIRLVLDGSDGLSIRFQFLSIPMSEAEQATFFARWGDDIQTVIADGFGQTRKVLARMQFLYEASLPLDIFRVTIELDREYDAIDIGHFRFFCTLSLNELRDGLFMVQFGATDNPNRNEAKTEADLISARKGIKKGIMGGQWELRASINGQEGDTNNANEKKYTRVGSFVSVGVSKDRTIRAEFGQYSFLRLRPHLRLSDLDGCMFALLLSRNLAEKIKSVHVYGNEYKLGEFNGSAIGIETGYDKLDVDLVFSNEELKDQWVRVMSKFGPFRLNFSKTTPLRMNEPTEIIDTLSID